MTVHWIIFFIAVFIAGLVSGAIWAHFHYTSWEGYRRLMASPRRMRMMRKEQLDAVDDANYHHQHDQNEQNQD